MPIRNKEKLDALAAKLANVPTSAPEYKNWMQRLDEAAQSGNKEAKYTLDKTIEYATANRKGYDGLQEFAMAATTGVPGISGFVGSLAGEEIDKNIGGSGVLGNIIGGLVGGAVGASHDIMNIGMKNVKSYPKKKHKVNKKIDWPSYGGESISDLPYSRITPKEVFDKLVDDNGDINKESLDIFLKDATSAAKKLGYSNINSAYDTFSSGRSHSLIDHSIKSANTAQSSPIPLGSNKKEFVTTALIHDIGKLAGIKGHADIGYNILKDITESNPKYNHVLYSVKNHMFPGNKSYFRNTGINYVENPNLTLATMFSDVANGKSFEEAASNYPMLSSYKKVIGKKLQYPEKWEDQLSYINRILHAYKYPKIKAKTYEEASEKVNEIIQRHNTFLRGVRDPMKEIDDDIGSIRNKENSIKLLKRRGLENNDLNRNIVTLEHIPLDPTGSGRVALFEKDWKTGVIEHSPTRLSSYYKISPKDYDALYVSTSEDIAKRYSDTTDSRSKTGLAGLVRRKLDLSSKNLLERFVQNEFLILDHSKIEYGNSPISNWNKYKLPYMIQTGKPFSTEYGKFIDDIFKKEGKSKYKKTSHLIPVGVDPEYDNFAKIASDLNWNTKPGWSPYVTMVEDGNFYIKTDPLTSKLKSDIDGAYNDFKFKQVFYEENPYAIRAVQRKTQKKINQFLKKYFQDIKGKKIGSYSVLNPEYKKALYDGNLMREFLIKNNLEGVESMPYFNGENLFIGSNGDWGKTPFKITSKMSDRAPQLLIPGRKGEKRLTFIKDIILDEDGIKNNSSRDSGKRTLRNDITRKTFQCGGKINQAE